MEYLGELPTLIRSTTLEVFSSFMLRLTYPLIENPCIHFLYDAVCTYSQ